jgi:hypothetical protein
LEDETCEGLYQIPEEIAPDVNSPDATLVSFKPRSIVNIIPQLLEVIPSTEEKLIIDIKKYKESLWNKAPELYESSELRNPLVVILNRNIVSIEHDWQKKLAAIFNGVDF